MRTNSFFALNYLNAFALLLLLCGSAAAQTDSVYTGNVAPSDSNRHYRERNTDWMEKFTYGGNFQLQFGSFTFIYLSPTIGYSPFEKFNFGVGFIYNYISLDYGRPYGKVSQSVFGGHSYARYFVTDNVFLQGQYDLLRQPDVYSVKPNAKAWVRYVLVGGGFRQPIGDKAALSSSILYNLTPSDLSIYPGRLILQFGFMANF